MSNKTLSMNQLVPDFTAESTIKPFNLSDYKGRNLVIYFYPKDNTPGCTTESIGFRDAYPAFQAANTAVAGISRDSLKSHENFSKKLDLPFPLISDPEEALCNQFDVMKVKKRYGKLSRGIERSTFLVNAKGELVQEWRNVKVAGHVEEVLQAAQELSKE
ncbi:MAG: peroxiredoxin [Oxalobacter sp.]|nr:peroxiredoxin [Oxalobacter sp.]